MTSIEAYSCPSLLALYLFRFRSPCRMLLLENQARRASVKERHLYSSIHDLNFGAAYSSRIARPRLVARASLTQLSASGGKLDSLKSGRSLANDNSCSLFNRRWVSDTFSRGQSCQLNSFNCTQIEKQTGQS